MLLHFLLRLLLAVLPSRTSIKLPSQQQHAAAQQQERGKQQQQLGCTHR